VEKVLTIRDSGSSVTKVQGGAKDDSGVASSQDFARVPVVAREAVKHCSERQAVVRPGIQRNQGG
jgi:hypothetical protein